ncbi:hypothetical protein, conserved [Eimeria brunetti]|uniref:Uncharacterized protein n=1 Tax=Eimeria brunetti TaxID=51314 RepID=U6LSE7_9EIME|nr:hypothetical protein, conserved [Eimeria brunetti]
MWAQPSPAPFTAGEEEGGKGASADLHGMLPVEATNGRLSTDVAKSLSAAPREGVSHMRRSPTRNRTYTVLTAIFSLAAVVFLISSCVWHLKVRRGMPLNVQTRRLATGGTGPCDTLGTEGGLEEQQRAPLLGTQFEAYRRQVQALTVQPHDIKYLTEEEVDLIDVAMSMLTELGESVANLLEKKRAMEESVARLSRELEILKTPTTEALEAEVRHTRAFITNIQTALAGVEVELEEKQQRLAASCWSQKQERAALLLRAEGLLHNRALTVGAARNLAARNVVIAAGVPTYKDHEPAYVPQVRQLLQEGLASALLATAGLETDPSPEAANQGKLSLEELKQLEVGLPFFGLHDKLGLVTSAREKLEAALKKASSSGFLGRMDGGRGTARGSVSSSHGRFTTGPSSTSLADFGYESTQRRESTASLYSSGDMPYHVGTLEHPARRLPSRSRRPHPQDIGGPQPEGSRGSRLSLSLPRHFPGPHPQDIGGPQPEGSRGSRLSLSLPRHFPGPHPQDIGGPQPEGSRGSRLPLSLPRHQRQPQPHDIRGPQPEGSRGSRLSLSLPRPQRQPQPQDIGGPQPEGSRGSRLSLSLPRQQLWLHQQDIGGPQPEGARGSRLPLSLPPPQRRPQPQDIGGPQPEGARGSRLPLSLPRPQRQPQQQDMSGPQPEGARGSRLPLSLPRQQRQPQQQRPGAGEPLPGRPQAPGKSSTSHRQSTHSQQLPLDTGSKTLRRPRQRPLSAPVQWASSEQPEQPGPASETEGKPSKDSPPAKDSPSEPKGDLEGDPHSTPSTPPKEPQADPAPVPTVSPTPSDESMTLDLSTLPAPDPDLLFPVDEATGESHADDGTTAPPGPGEVVEASGTTEDGGASGGGDPPSDQKDTQPPPSADGQQPAEDPHPPPEKPPTRGQPTPPGEDPPPPERPPPKSEPADASGHGLEEQLREMSAGLAAFAAGAGPVASKIEEDRFLLPYGEDLLRAGLKLYRGSWRLVSAALDDSPILEKVRRQREECFDLCTRLHRGLYPTWASALRSKLRVLEKGIRNCKRERQRPHAKLPSTNFVDLLAHVNSVATEGVRLVSDISPLNSEPISSPEVKALLQEIDRAASLGKQEVLDGVQYCVFEWKNALQAETGAAEGELEVGADESPRAPEEQPVEDLLQKAESVHERLKTLGDHGRLLESLEKAIKEKRSTSSKS